MDLAFDASEVSPSSTSAGSVIQSLGLGMFCYQSPSPAIVTVTWGCTVLGMASTTSAGELAVAEFALKGNTGCARFHIVTYGPPDGGDLITGSYTIDAATPGAQQNTYGGDITVNLADGSVGCAAPPLTVTPTETPFPSVKATNTPLPTDTPTPIGTEGVAAKDVALVIDRSGSMADAPCTGPNDQSGCKIHEAKSAANSFIDQLIARSGFTKVGYAPFAGCYNPPLSNALCVPAPAPSNVLTSVNCNSPGASLVACLFADPTTAHNLINATQPNGGTNLCSGLSEGLKILRGPGNQLANPTTKDVVVLLTDGDNEYDASTSTGLDAACVPTGALGNDLCNSVRSGANRSLDLKTHQIARAMKANNTEIFIIQMYSDSCAPPDAIYSASDCNSNVGNADPPLVASPRLLQCMASSSPGTNDHYFKTNDATTLTSIMQVIAGMIKS
jgi:Mg-chelatase subunit ChlD